MRILAVDTALGACSVAVLADDTILAHRFAVMERGHAEALAPMVEDAMQGAGLGFAALDRLGVTVGPGTFTGQRVGLAFMRGLRVALGRPLVGVTTLACMARQASAETKTDLAAAIHDARRGEVYIEIVVGKVSLLPPALMTFADAVAAIAQHADAGAMALAGTAAPMAAEHLKRLNVKLSNVRQPDALWVARLTREAPEPTTAPRPLYLRAPDAKPSVGA